MNRFAAMTLFDRAEIVRVASCAQCPFRGWKGDLRCHWSSSRGRKITGDWRNGFPVLCPLPERFATPHTPQNPNSQ